MGCIAKTQINIRLLKDIGFALKIKILLVCQCQNLINDRLKDDIIA